MKTLLLKLVPGIAATLAAIALGALAMSRAQSNNNAPAPAYQVPAPAPNPAPVVIQQAPQPAVMVCPNCGATVVNDPATRQVYFQEPIAYAPAYYGPQYYDNTSQFSDPFTAIRVNPIPWPVNYYAPRAFGYGPPRGFAPARRFHN